jgi:uncharacterized protein YacL
MIFFARLLIVSLFVFISAKTDWSYFFPGFDLSEGFRVVVGLVIGLMWVGLDLIFRRISGRVVLSVLLGIFIGLLVNRLFISVITLLPLSERFLEVLGIFMGIGLAYLGAIIVLRGQKEFNFIIPFVSLETRGVKSEAIYLDTSVIIDGRIVDMCETNFFSGMRLYVPRFVLKELQLIADSSDPIKRSRGRRGLDILNKIKASAKAEVKIHEMDFRDVGQVDAKLVKLARASNGKIFTNDYNLNKVAALQGVEVLNINDLANAIKPMLTPGEQITVKILKEGKELDQGIAYMDDGTMIVVDHAKHYVGKNIQAAVSSVLQTSAGRMIFAKLVKSDE